MRVTEALRQFQPGFEQTQLKNFGTMVGTRESRHIIGRAQLTENDIYNEGRHADSVGAFLELIGRNDHLKLLLKANYFQIPYGIMIPQQIESLLVCERAIDAGNFAYAIIRSTGCCTVTGEGVGTTAVIAIKNNTTVPQADIQTVQERSRQNGVKVL